MKSFIILTYSITQLGLIHWVVSELRVQLSRLHAHPLLPYGICLFNFK